MSTGLVVLVAFAMSGCPNSVKEPVATERNIPMSYMPEDPLLLAPADLQDEFTEFNKGDHLRAPVSRDDFDRLHTWDLGWAVLSGLKGARDDEHEVELAKTFSPGQKALYFFWYLDGQVTNGGFIQFFLNGYQRYVPTILSGLELVGDTTTARLLKEAHGDCWKHREEFELVAAGKQDWSWLRKRLPEMDKIDSDYFKHHEHAMELIERFIRDNPDEFVVVNE